MTLAAAAAAAPPGKRSEPLLGLPAGEVRRKTEPGKLAAAIVREVRRFGWSG
jgi:hypothetical protein